MSSAQAARVAPAGASGPVPSSSATTSYSLLHPLDLLSSLTASTSPQPQQQSQASSSSAIALLTLASYIPGTTSSMGRHAQPAGRGGVRQDGLGTERVVVRRPASSPNLRTAAAAATTTSTAALLPSVQEQDTALQARANSSEAAQTSAASSTTKRWGLMGHARSRSMAMIQSACRTAGGGDPASSPSQRANSNPITAAEPGRDAHHSLAWYGRAPEEEEVNGGGAGGGNIGSLSSGATSWSPAAPAPPRPLALGLSQRKLAMARRMMEEAEREDVAEVEVERRRGQMRMDEGRMDEEEDQGGYVVHLLCLALASLLASIPVSSLSTNTDAQAELRSTILGASDRLRLGLTWDGASAGNGNGEAVQERRAGGAGAGWLSDGGDWCETVVRALVAVMAWISWSELPIYAWTIATTLVTLIMRLNDRYKLSAKVAATCRAAVGGPAFAAILAALRALASATLWIVLETMRRASAQARSSAAYDVGYGRGPSSWLARPPRGWKSKAD